MKNYSVVLCLIFILYFPSLWAKDAALPVVTVTAAAEKKPSAAQSSRKKIGNSANYGSESIKVEKKSVMNTQQLLTQLPGVSIAGGTLAISKAPTVRGLTGNQLNVTIDGISNPFAGFGHNNIRLLPGAGLLKAINVETAGDSFYGSGNIGGAVEFTTLDPEDYLRPGEKIGAELSQEFQSGAPGFESSIAVFSHWGKYRTLFKIIGNQFQNIHLGNGQTFPNSAQNNLQYLGKVVIKPDAFQTIKLSILSLQNVGTYSNIISTDRPSSLSNFNFLQQQQQLEYSFKPENPYINFKAKLYHLDVNQKSTPVDASQGPQAINIETTGVLLRNTSKLDNHYLTYGMGADYQHGKDLNQGFLSFPSAHATHYAGFLRDKFKLGQKLQAIVGLRFDVGESSNNILSNKVSHLGKELGLNYQLTPIFSVYTKYAEGFRYPTLDELYLGGAHPPYINILPNPNLQPESNANKEFGWKLDKQNVLQSGDKFTLKNSIFLNDIHNYILGIPLSDPKGGYQNQNITGARLYGYTVSAHYQRQNNLAWYATAGYTRGYNTTPYPALGNTTVPAGTVLPSVPPFQGNIGMIVPIRERQDMQLQMNFSSRQHEVRGVSPAIGGYTTYDLYYQWHLPIQGLNMIAFAQNITDKYYAVYSGASVQPGGLKAPLPAMGRNLGLRVSYRF